MSVRRIAVLTGGGDCPGLNAVIRAVVKAAQNVHGWEVWGIRDGLEGFLRPGEEGIRRIERADIAGILPLGGTILGASNRVNLFAVARGKGRPRDESAVVKRRLKDRGISALVVIGGDGTQMAASRLLDEGVPIVSVPKTIDNDLAGTDVTFGHDSAVSVVGDALDRLHTTVQSHHRAMCVEVMGRHSGWIALHGGIAGGADAILIPEIPYDPERILQRIRSRVRVGRRFSIVVVAEGARKGDGRAVYRTGKGRDPILDRLGGVADVVRMELGRGTDLEVRHVVLGHLQRGGSPTPFDRVLATRFGAKAVQMIADGEFGRMASLRGTEIVSTDLKEAIRAPKLVDPAGDLVRMAREIGVSFAAADGADDAFARVRARHGAP
jgi:phosphofructokinase-like protein